MTLTRRKFNLLGGATALSLGLSASAPALLARARPKAVVIGGGAGGATAARYIAKDSGGAIQVTLIEPTRRYYTCFFSNLYLGGFRSFQSLGHGYETLATRYGVNIVHDWATAIDRDRREVILGSGVRLAYDRLIVAPGIELQFDSVPGYSLTAASLMPHAWKSGTQAQLLKARVHAMKAGGTFVMIPPPAPYRCPPGPYERVSMIAHLFKRQNPDAKIIVLDPKPGFSKQALFMEGWEKHYPGMIEWIPPDVHGGVTRVDPESMTIETDLDSFNADAACIIPAQKAGAIARTAGLTDASGWCPVEPATMQSRLDENIHVIGDASIAAAMPKSAFAANSQAKSAAMAVRKALIGARAYPARYVNTCWSLIAPDDGVKVGARYRPGAGRFEVMSKFISKPGETQAMRRQTYQESLAWYASITKDIFG
ncbi:MAG: NAD(P)/FAD-dependent oxidoreductase [Methyloligellaceae bacterium]